MSGNVIFPVVTNIKQGSVPSWQLSQTGVYFFLKFRLGTCTYFTNEELHRRAEIEPISTQVKRRRWRWIGHVLRQQTTALTRIALRWTPDGQRKRGRPKETWRRTVEREMKEKGWTWGRLERVSADRHRWRALVEALCATWSTKRTRWIDLHVPKTASREAVECNRHFPAAVGIELTMCGLTCLRLLSSVVCAALKLFVLFVGCLTSQQHASVSQGRICSDNFTEIEVAD